MQQKRNIPAAIDRILCRLEKAGFEGYLVGGCVRDRLMGKEPHDYDLTTSALPEELLKLFEGERIIGTGLKHGTVTVLTEMGGVEVTTYRQDGTYTDHRHPDQVLFTRSLKEDLARRDFTVNAMAMDRQGQIIDLFGGQEDLQNKRIRCVGEPCRRFEEDALRILRGLRFAARLGFAIEEETAAAMLEKRALLDHIAAERIFSELSGLLSGADCKRVIVAHRKVLEQVLPELKGLELTEAFRRLEQASAEPALGFAALLAEMDPETVRALLSRLKVSNAFAKEVCCLVEEYPKACLMERRAVHRRCAQMGVPLFLKLTELWGKREVYDPLVTALLEEGACLSLKELAVNGKDLQALGLKGAAIGETLAFLLEQVVDEQLVNEKEILLKAIKNDR